MSEVIVRIPPSPTGNLHIGTARTALFNYLFAKQHGGKVILRLEDTDKKRSTKEFEKNIIEGLAWLGITYDEMYRQSERIEIYTKYLEQLIADNKAYASKEAAQNGDGEIEVIRFKNPNATITFTDLVRGEISFDTEELGDFVIAKSMTEPLYHLAVVVDDHEMKISHVIRGEDHISNTPRQILILEALGFKRPEYAHIPLILGRDKSKLSKRHGAVALTRYRDDGYLKEAMINYLALLGWNPGGEQEVFTLDELIKQFDLAKVQKGAAIFDLKKFRWFNKTYLARVDDVTLTKEITKRLEKHNPSADLVQKLLPIVRERIEAFCDITHMDEAGEFAYLFAEPKLDAEQLVWKKSTPEATKTHLAHTEEVLTKLSEWTGEAAKEAIWDYAEKEGKGDVLWPLRYALSGKQKSPDPFTLIGLLGKKATLLRIKVAIDTLS